MSTRYENYIKSLTVDKVADEMADKYECNCEVCPIFPEAGGWRNCEAFQSGSLTDCAGKFKEWLMEEADKPKRKKKEYLIWRKNAPSITWNISACNMQEAIAIFEEDHPNGNYRIRLKNGKSNYCFNT